MLEEIKLILKENYDVENVELDTNFKNDLDLSSFDFVNLVCIIEEKFKVVIDEEEYRNLNTIKDLIDYLERIS